jgi:hypothetical protein
MAGTASSNPSPVFSQRRRGQDRRQGGGQRHRDPGTDFTKLHFDRKTIRLNFPPSNFVQILTKNSMNSPEYCVRLSWIS